MIKPARLLRNILISCLVLVSLGQPALALNTTNDYEAIGTGLPYYDPGATETCSVSGTGSSLGATLEGHTLPATSGGAGIEEEAKLSGGKAVLVRNGAGLALAPAGMTDNDVKFYMNMRWRYRTWAWDGTSRSGPEDSAWYNQSVRKVLISDPKTNKSVVASVLEAGPAPWTGTTAGKDNPPSYWNGYVDGTPEGYDGRVSGLSPAVFAALGDPAAQWTKGAGTALTYQWADQSLPAGTIGTAAGGGQTTGTGATTGSCAAGDAAALGGVVETALSLAWPDTKHGKRKADATPAYQEAMPKYNGSTGNDEWSDCGVFVATVMIMTGADPDFPKRGTGTQLAYVRKHPEKYTIIDNISDSSKLQAGDILIYNQGGIGHIFIYTGKQPGSNYDSASASLHSHVPQAANALGSITYGGRAGEYVIARLK